MTFKVEPDATFPVTLTIIGQGREQKLELVFRHRTREEYLGQLKAIREEEKTTSQVILEMVESWKADADLTLEVLDKLQQTQPGMDWAIITGYGDAHQVARKGN